MIKDRSINKRMAQKKQYIKLRWEKTGLEQMLLQAE